MLLKNKFICLLFFLIGLSYSQDLKPLGKYNSVVSHNYYSLSYSEEHEQAEWVYYILNSSQFNATVERSNNFKSDKLIKTSSSQLSDYKGSGYHRGHLAPAADMKYNNISMSESFFMSNVSPQTPSFNTGIWKRIEKTIRDWSYLYGELVIITGPVLNGEFLGTIGANDVTIPKWYYKVAIDLDNYNRNIAFLVENKGSSESIKSLVVSIDYLEEFSGLDFFHALSDEVEESFESSTHTGLWNWNVKAYPKSSVTIMKNGTIDHTKDHLPSNGKIYRTNTGKKYHKENCRYLSKSKIPITLNEAQEKGLDPCGVCKP
ncbi:MAG: DNA/RNA endonuclease [Crocinitomicaceae bacterium]|nr:DNA/RNA endonuclease [Crocinitomicaceae bacterium]|tara:strand:- start:2473 stop:3423 length:951 start_codon:yes stop_codon:yes gene_type:complete